MNELAYANALDDLQVKYSDLEQEHEELLTQFNASEECTIHLEECVSELLDEKARLEEQLKQVVEDSELCRDRNRDLEAEARFLKVALYKCFGVADVMEIRRNINGRDVQRWSQDLKRHITEGLHHDR